MHGRFSQYPLRWSNAYFSKNAFISALALNPLQNLFDTYKFAKEYIDPKAPGGKEHVGYIIDRVGFKEFKKWALEGVELPPETIVKDNVYWNGIHFR